MVVALIALFVALGGSVYAAKKIGTKQLKNKAVTTKKIKNAAVTGAKLANGAVSTGKIANNAVTSGKIAPGTLDSLTIGRSTSTSCDPASAGFVDCGTVSLNLPRAGPARGARARDRGPGVRRIQHQRLQGRLPSRG